MTTIESVRHFSLSLPESKEINHWGKPSFRVNNKIFAVIQDDGFTLTVKTVAEDRSMLTTLDPETFKVPDSFSNLNYMNINLTRVEEKELKGLILKAWSSIAPKKLVNKYFEGLKE
ncbi:MmcQ/YjbR family DNA-binding protein [Cohnella terricola]|uniref:MmcQ/YjbR family DNA-binding protein n=1 Tax=Cohnella terricola TaxID=1289167 RepID=A0A559JFM8_9BACL|nr:MmcQ/YjbR family DNA-binding protein [Cohnella terricola]TVX98682.1 MmcQ/YjbR family DNA-binding protein [Cohnella terricola]